MTNKILTMFSNGMPVEFLANLTKSCIDDYLNAKTPEEKDHASHILRGAISALGLKLVMLDGRTPEEIERQIDLAEKGYNLLNVDDPNKPKN